MLDFSCEFGKVRLVSQFFEHQQSLDLVSRLDEVQDGLHVLKLRLHSLDVLSEICVTPMIRCSIVVTMSGFLS